MLRNFFKLSFFILLTACSDGNSDTNSSAESTTTRPTLYYVTAPGAGDLTDYQEIADIVARFYTYRKIVFSGGYDELMAKSKFDRLKAMPNFKRSIDYWEYLERRDPPNKLMASDVATIRRLGLKQVPVIVVEYTDGERRYFDRQMSAEMFSMMVSQGQFRTSEGAEVLDSFFNIADDEDRPQLVSWLENAILR